MSFKRKLRRNKAKKATGWCLAIVDGSGKFGPDSCALMPVSEAIRKGFPYAPGKDPIEMWENMMRMGGFTEEEIEYYRTK